MARLTKRSSKRDDTFFEALAFNGVVGYACEVAGYNRTSAFTYRRDDPEFAARWVEALERATERLEAEAIRRANEGVESYVVNRGALVFIDSSTPVLDEQGNQKLDKDGNPMWVKVALVEKKYSDTLTIFMLKARRPQVYRDRYDVSVTAKVENIVNLSEAELELIARKGLEDGDQADQSD